MPEGPLGNIQFSGPFNQPEIAVKVLVEGLDEEIDGREVERVFREKTANPRMDIKVDSGIVERQKVIWKTRSTDINAGDVKRLIKSVSEVVGDIGFFDFETTGFEATSIEVEI